MALSGGSSHGKHETLRQLALSWQVPVLVLAIFAWAAFFFFVVRVRC